MVLLKKHCVAALSDAMADVGTTVFGRVKLNVSMGGKVLPSEDEWYVSDWLVKVRAKGLLVLLRVRLAGMPPAEEDVEGVSFVA